MGVLNSLMGKKKQKEAPPLFSPPPLKEEPPEVVSKSGSGSLFEAPPILNETAGAKPVEEPTQFVAPPSIEQIQPSQIEKPPAVDTSPGIRTPPLPIRKVKQEIPQNLPQMPKFAKDTPTPKPGFGSAKELPKYTDVDIEPLPSLDIDLKEIPELDIEGDIYESIPDREKSYVRTDYYSQFLSNMASMRHYLVESSDIIYSLKNLKRNADIEHKNYKKVLEDIQRKIIYVDKVLFS